MKLTRIVLFTAIMLVGCVPQRDNAEAEARAYASNMNMKLHGVSCVDYDTDGDGYVSCTLNVDEGNGQSRTEAIECATMFSWNSGCRAVKLQFGTRRNR